MRFDDATPDDLIIDMEDIHPHVRIKAISTCARAALYKPPAAHGNPYVQCYFCRDCSTESRRDHCSTDSLEIIAVMTAVEIIAALIVVEVIVALAVVEFIAILSWYSFLTCRCRVGVCE